MECLRGPITAPIVDSGTKENNMVSVNSQAEAMLKKCLVNGLSDKD